MNIKHRMFWLVPLSSALIVQHTLADVQLEPPTKKSPAAPPPARQTEKTTPGETTAIVTPAGQLATGIVNGDNVNVRGKATIKSEVVSRLKKGDQVTIMEEITHKQPSPGDVAEWFKIALPKGTHLWVHSDFVDANTMAVKASELNMRSGPGENYSILGRIDKGTVVKVLETKNAWLKVDPPPDAYGFVAASLVDRTVIAPPPTVAKVVPPPAPVPTEEPKTDEHPTEVVDTTPPAEAKPPTEEKPSAEKSTTPADVVMNPPTDEQPTPSELAEITEPPPPEPVEPPKRIVTREGIVKRSTSIQAPTEFMLESLDTKRTINYLYSPSSNIFLLDFKGQRIQVTGEEGLVDRWPKTPVLTIETLKSVR